MEDFDFEKIIHGNVYQLWAKDTGPLGRQLFSEFDSDHDKVIDSRDAKAMLRGLHKTVFQVKKAPNFTPQQYQNFFNILKGKDKETASDKDLEALAERYFINSDKQGSADIEVLNQSFFRIDTTAENRKSHDDLHEGLKKLGEERFGKALFSTLFDAILACFQLEKGAEKLTPAQFEAGARVMTKKIALDPQYDLEEKDYSKIFKLASLSASETELSRKELEIWIFKCLIGS